MGDVARPSELENSGTFCPTSDVAPKKRCKFFGDGRKLFPAASDLQEVEGYDGINETTHRKCTEYEGSHYGKA
jgi:hypothetical protein